MSKEGVERREKESKNRDSLVREVESSLTGD